MTRIIDASPEAIWALLTDASTWTDWNPSVVSIEGPIEKGSTIKLVSAVNPKRTFTLKVTTFAPPRKLVWSDGMALGLFKGERTYLIDPTGEGTAFTMTETFSGPIAGLITKMIPDLTESFAQFADGLKRAAESS